MAQRHFPLWNKSALLARSIVYYQAILPGQGACALSGYAGARWPKMTVASVWTRPQKRFGTQLQPHPIYYAEILYRANPSREVLERYEQIVIESAEFMASYLRWDEATKRYVLGPGLIPAQENHKMQDVLNPTFELEYWVFGLRTANEWLGAAWQGGKTRMEGFD